MCKAGDSWPPYYRHPLQILINTPSILPPPRRRRPLPPSSNKPLLPRDSRRIRIRALQFEHRLTQLRLTQQQQPHVPRDTGHAVIGAFGRDVGEVDAFAEHVAADGGFGRSDAEALGEDAAVVGAARAVPEETAVALCDFGVGGGGEAGFFAVA